MEILFTGVFSQFEASLVLVLFGVILTILASYAYQYIERIIRIFWPKKRDAKMEVRDEETLKNRENNEKEEEEKELPPPLTVEEIENSENLEEKNISGDFENNEQCEENNEEMLENINEWEKEISENGENSDAKEVEESEEMNEWELPHNENITNESNEMQNENTENNDDNEEKLEEIEKNWEETTENKENAEDSSDLIAKIRQAEEEMNETSEMQTNNADTNEMHLMDENVEEKDDDMAKSCEKQEAMNVEKSAVDNAENVSENSENQSENDIDAWEDQEENQSENNENMQENLSEQMEENGEEKEENKENQEDEEKKNEKDAMGVKNNAEKEWELPHGDEKNTEKTFEEIEKESDKDFSDEIAPEIEKTEEKWEELISEKTNDLIQKSSQNIAEIIKKEHTKKENSHIEKLYELTNQAKTLMARGLMSEAKTTIIEGIALKKNHRELNLLLGEIYEAEKHFDKAEIIYKDLALEHTEDEEILKHLANNLIITRKTEIAYEIYKKIFSLGNDEENALYMLANLARELEDISDVYHYSRLYLKKWPMDKDMLALLSESQIVLGKRKEAIETLIKLKNLSPYDADEMNAYIEKLRTEEEMAKNFTTENQEKS